MRIDQLMSIMNEVDGEIVITKVENIQVHNFNISLDAQKTLFSKKLTCVLIILVFMLLEAEME